MWDIIQRLNLRIGFISQLFDPKMGYCLCCETNWKFVIPHSTRYSRYATCEALCEKCWIEMNAPKDRLPYYLTMWRRWRDEGMATDIEWQMICESVLRGG